MAPAARVAQAAQVDRVEMVPGAVLGTTTPLAEGKAEAKENGPLLEAVLHRAEDLEEVMVMGTTTGTKERRGVEWTQPC